MYGYIFLVKKGTYFCLNYRQSVQPEENEEKKTTVQAGIVRVSVIGLILMVFLILLNIFLFFRKKVSSPLSQMDKALMAE